MALTALEIKDKTFNTKMFGYNTQEVEEFLDIVVDDYEEQVRLNREKDSRIKELEDKLAYFDEMKESLSQSVILAQETAEKVKLSANTESTNLLTKATYESEHLIEGAKQKANQILRDATDEAKRVAIETEELKRQTRVFHQRLMSTIEGQLGLINSPEWTELLQPTAVYLQNSDAAFKEVVEKVLDEEVKAIRRNIIKDKKILSYRTRVTFVLLNLALTITLHCKVCFPIVAVMIAFPAFLPVTLPFLETDAIFSSDEDHFTALSVPDTFKVVLVPEGNEITVWLSFGVAALTDDESKDMADDKIKAMARNMLSVFFKFFMRPP